MSPAPARCGAAWRRLAAGLALSVVGFGSALAQAPADAPSKHLAPGFTQLPADTRVVLMPADVELFSLSAGGVAEPRADWTAAAHGHVDAALKDLLRKLGLAMIELDDATAEEFAEQLGLQAAVARSISLHHATAGWELPSKQGRLDWSLGSAMQPLQVRAGGRYAVFVRVRDSYASGERKAAMVAMALLGVGIGMGVQYAHASLVDLETGRVLWFNELLRPTGDLRQADKAAETVRTLLDKFPSGR